MNTQNFITLAIDAYPKDFYDFSGGLNLSDSEIHRFIKDGINSATKKLEDNKILNEAFSAISTGNTKVFVEAYRETRSGNTFTINVTVTKNYQDKSKCGVLGKEI